MEEISIKPRKNSEKIFTKQLQKKYDISRVVVDKRLKALYIQPSKGPDNRSWITPDQLQLMDELHAHLNNNGTTNEFVQRCIDAGRIEVPVENSQTPNKTVALAKVNKPNSRAVLISTHEQNYDDSNQITISPSSSQQDLVTNLQDQKGEQVQANDIQEIRERAQKRAFSKAVAEDTLTLIYEATEDFTPEMKEHLEAHRAQCRRAREQRNAAHDVNDFLSKALASQIT